MPENYPLLMIPGPTQVPPSSLKVMDQQMFNHRSPRFSELFERVTEKIKKVVDTKQKLFILPSSGTGAMEASFSNVVNPGDKVLSISIGIFGDRYRKIAKAFGGKVIPMDIEWGHMAHASDVKAMVKKHKPDAVVMTHNETSTGVTNPIEEIAEVVRDESLLLVDGVSSIGAIDYHHDKWGIDTLATGSQKALMAPPGAGIVALSKRAWEHAQDCKNSNHYFDLCLYDKYYESKKQTPTTPPIPQILALDKSLDMILDKGPKACCNRHAVFAEATRASITAMGLKPFAKEGFSQTVTSICSPVDSNKVIAHMRDKYNVEVAGGKGHVACKVFRIGHMGFVSSENLLTTLEAVQNSLRDLGFEAKDGIPAAKEVLNGL